MGKRKSRAKHKDRVLIVPSGHGYCVVYGVRQPHDRQRPLHRVRERRRTHRPRPITTNTRKDTAVIVTAPAKVAARHADDWHTTSIHEAGHVVAAMHLGIPVSDVWIAHDRSMFGWSVLGRTNLVGGHFNADEDQAMGFAYAGVEAQAIHLAARDRLPIGAARRRAEGTRTNRNGDMAELYACMADPNATLTLGQVRDHTNRIVTYYWASVENIAALLRKHGSLTGDQAARAA